MPDTAYPATSDPRDPSWPEPSAFIYQRSNCVSGFVFAARGDARPPGDGGQTILML